MNDTNRNMVLAIVLSIIVLFGWQFFVAGPQMERAQRDAQPRLHRVDRDAQVR